jgi:hypothetical protein
LRGGTLLSLYNWSPALLLSSVYNDYIWLPWKFSHVAKGFWNDVNNQREFLNWVATQLNYKDTTDWYKITTEVQFSRKILKKKKGIEKFGR